MGAQISLNENPSHQLGAHKPYFENSYHQFKLISSTSRTQVTNNYGRLTKPPFNKEEKKKMFLL